MYSHTMIVIKNFISLFGVLKSNLLKIPVQKRQINGLMSFQKVLFSINLKAIQNITQLFFDSQSRN